MDRTLRYPQALLSLMAVGVAPMGFAQQAGGSTAASADELTEIVVTAQKRPENLQDVPIAITVVSAQQLTEQHVTTIADLSRTAPALEMIQSFGGPGGGGQIRGIGTQSFSRSAEGAVGIVVDGVSQGNLNINNIFDVARIEVLRGPQGTLFGLTSSAGVINIVTNAPDPNKFDASLHVDYAHNGTAGSDYGQTTVQSVVNIPLSGSSALRVAGSIDDNLGVQRNTFNGTDGSVDNYALRGHYLLDTDPLTISVIADYQRIIQDGAQGGSIASFTYASADPTLTAQLAACGITPGFGNQDRCANHLQLFYDSAYGLSAQADYKLASATLTSISAYRRDETGPLYQDIQALPSANPQIYSGGNLSASRQWSEELRVASNAGAQLEYTAGLFFSNFLTLGYPASTGAFFNVKLSIPGTPIIIEAPGTGPSTTLTQTTISSQAVFAHLQYHATDALTFIGGARVTREQVGDYSSPLGRQPGSAGNAGSTTLSEDQNNVSGVVGVQYKFSPQWTTYGTVTRGYKGPQAQAAGPPGSGVPAQIIPAEIPWAFELGLKGSVLNNRLGADFSVFDTRVQNYQGQTCALNTTGVLVCNPNSFDVTTRGVEVDFYGQPLDHLHINGGYIYDQARYPAGYTGLDPNNLNGGTTYMGGLQLVGVPKSKFTLSGDYAIPLGPVVAFVGSDVVYKSAIRLGYSADPGFVFPAAWNVSLRGGVRSADNRWGLAIFARDVNNSNEPITLFGGPAFTGPSPAVGGVPFFFNPAYPNGHVSGISGWVGAQSLREVGLSLDLRL
jgi:iron complex outermembrane receptor protein